MARDESGGVCFYGDLTRMLEGLPETAKTSLREDIHTKMKRAESGDLTFGSGKEFDVDLIVSSRIALEIRIVDHLACDPSGSSDLVKRHARVYFTEPDDAHGILLLMSAESKCPGPEGLEEQNLHAGRAAMRAEAHCGRR